MPLTAFPCLDKCERCLSGADVGSCLLPKKITHRHSWIQNHSTGWEARGPSSCSSRSLGSCCEIHEAAGISEGLAPSFLHGQSPGPGLLLNL